MLYADRGMKDVGWNDRSWDDFKVRNGTLRAAERDSGDSSRETSVPSRGGGVHGRLTRECHCLRKSRLMTYP